MANVHNWQLGRAMSYPYEEKHPRQQFAFVFNTNRCIGCQTCTMACKSTWTFSRGQEYMWWNNVESKPYGGYPQNWDSKLLTAISDLEVQQIEGKGSLWYLRYPIEGKTFSPDDNSSFIVVATTRRPRHSSAPAPQASTMPMTSMPGL